MSASLRIGVVGCGSIGKRHSRILLGLGERDLVVFDPSPERRVEIGSELGVAAVDTFDAVLDAKPDAVLICSPPNLHVSQAICAAERGCALFIEKPLSHSLDGLDQLAAAVATHGAVSFVACNFRFHPPLRRLRELIDHGTFGRLYSLRARFGQYLPDWRPTADFRQSYSADSALGGGVILDRIHELDYACWLLGPATAVAVASGRFSDLPIRAEDMAEILVRFASGALGSIHVDYLRRLYDCRCEVMGEFGFGEWVFQDHRLLWYDVRTGRETVETWRQAEVNTMYIEQMRHFLEVVRGDVASSNPVDSAVSLMRVALQARDQASIV